MRSSLASANKSSWKACQDDKFRHARLVMGPRLEAMDRFRAKDLTRDQMQAVVAYLEPV
jgi:hypothetical protein